MAKNGNEIESRLWNAADEMRANSKLKASEYSVPVLGLIFLRYADANNPYTYRVGSFPEDIEAFLGVEKTKPHRKPQHIMLRLQEKVIAPERLEALLSMIGGLLGVTSNDQALGAHPHNSASSNPGDPPRQMEVRND